MSYHCPKCGGLIYDRRLERCGFCIETIPAELRFSPAEMARKKREQLESDLRELRQRMDEQVTDEALKRKYDFLTAQVATIPFS